jgi:transcriptional regulator with XRE-family HTH domain
MSTAQVMIAMARVSGTASPDLGLARLGLAVRKRRLLLELSQEALADLAGIDRSHMGKIERGERNVTFLNVQKIAKALQCKASELLAGAGL